MATKASATITNAELGTVQVALRECGNTKIPMGVALRMVEVQRLIKDRIEDVQELNGGLVVRYGIPGEGEETATEVRSDMPGWPEYVAAFNDLMAQKLNISERFTLYQDGDELGWAEGTNGVSLSPNTIIDMAALLHIEKAE